MIKINLPAPRIESPKKEKNGGFSSLFISKITSSSFGTTTGFKILVIIIALMIFKGIAVNTNCAGSICIYTPIIAAETQLIDINDTVNNLS